MPTSDVWKGSLSPLSFLERSADVWADRTAVSDRGVEYSYAVHAERVGRLVALLRNELGVEAGERVAVLLPNIGPMLELHYAVPGAGAVLVPLNSRLSEDEYAYILSHSGAKLLFAYSPMRMIVERAVDQLGGRAPRIVWIDESPDAGEFEAMLGESACQPLELPTDERTLLSINYTSGTTGRPKGVMTSHRGAYLHSLGVVIEAGLGTRSVYLWTLPMFHCNGWAYTWANTAAGATHVCLAEVDPPAIWRELITGGITHLCAAPTVANMIFNSPDAQSCPRPVRLFIGGAPPAPSLLEQAADLNIDVTHLYGLTETYGPIAVCAWNPSWDDSSQTAKAAFRARQGVGTIVSQRLRVVDESMQDVPRDGKTIGEVVMRGDNVMMGYYRDEAASEAAFAGGWFHSGDLGVMCADGYLILRDRLKDVIISGGENISTIEVEQALVSHPAVSEVAVVGAADEKWGETPVAFVVLQEDVDITSKALTDHVDGRLARFKIPKRFEFVDALPKTATGKIQKYALREMLAAE